MSTTTPYQEYTASASSQSQSQSYHSIYGHDHKLRYEHIKIYFEPLDKIIVINWDDIENIKSQVIMSLDICDEKKMIVIDECWYSDATYDSYYTHADGFMHMIECFNYNFERNSPTWKTGFAACFGPFFGPGWDIRIGNNDDDEDNDAFHYIANPISKQTWDTANRIVKLIDKGQTTYMRPQVAATIIQMWFKGWAARKQFRYNPHTTLGKHLVLQELKEFHLFVSH